MNALKVFGLMCSLLTTGASAASGQEKSTNPADADPYRWQPLSLVQASERELAHATKESTSTAEKEEAKANPLGFREVSDFFNIREANANVGQGKWEFEVPMGWATRSNGHDDDFNLGAKLKYGITDDLYAEIGVLPLNIGDGGDQGNGDLDFSLFWQFLHEQDMRPAMALWTEMRIPSGEGSSGVDAELHLNVTKTIARKCRVHLEGFIETANGERGGEGGEVGGEGCERRHFQWGLGPGFDYQFTDDLIGVINYENRSGEEEGSHNLNVLQVGADYRIAPHQHLKAAIDIGLDGQEENPNLAAKIQWSIEW